MKNRAYIAVFLGDETTLTGRVIEALISLISKEGWAGQNLGCFPKIHISDNTVLRDSITNKIIYYYGIRYYELTKDKLISDLNAEYERIHGEPLRIVLHPSNIFYDDEVVVEYRRVEKQKNVSRNRYATVEIGIPEISDGIISYSF